MNKHLAVTFYTLTTFHVGTRNTWLYLLDTKLTQKSCTWTDFAFTRPLHLEASFAKLCFLGIRIWSWKVWGLVSVCQSIHKILSHRPHCWLPSRELYDLQKSACWEHFAQLFYPVEPKYRFRLQKGVKNEDEKHFKIFNTN